LKIKTPKNERRFIQLIKRAIDAFQLDLSGFIVLTEAATGNFICTPLIAALANAKKVFAIAKDSCYGKAQDVKEMLFNLGEKTKVDQKIEVVFNKLPEEIIKQADIITNLGHVRPIDRTMIDLMKPTAVISLMCEPWELRSQDLDLDSCAKRRLLVLGTDENDSKLNIFRYVGLTALKLLLEAEIEVYKSRILVVGGGFFGKETISVLIQNGADVKQISKDEKDKRFFLGTYLYEQQVKEWIVQADAIVFVEHNYKGCLLGEKGELSPKELFFLNPAISIIHICGGVQKDELDEAGILYSPQRIALVGYMSITTDYVGPRPVIDLHTAGLKVGQAMADGRRKFVNLNEAKQYALKNSPALDFE
jgi:hypothetical protein